MIPGIIHATRSPLNPFAWRIGEGLFSTFVDRLGTGELLAAGEL